MKKRGNVKRIGLYFIISIVMMFYFYVQLIHIEVPIHSDDVGSATQVLDLIDRGTSDIVFWTQPMGWLNVFLYFLFGPTEFYLQIGFSLKYAICIFLILSIVFCRKEKINAATLLFLIFWLMPGRFGTASIQPLKFHVWPVIVTLFCIWYIKKYIDTSDEIRLRDILIVGGVALIGALGYDIIVMVIAWMPLFVYYMVYLYRRKFFEQHIIGCSILFIVVLIGVKVISCKYQYTGYGASCFVDVSTAIENIKIGIEGMMSMCNINLIDNQVLQFSTIFGCIRLLLMLFALYIILVDLKKMFKGENVNASTFVLVLGALGAILAYIFGGVREDAISIRYASYLYYVFAIILVNEFEYKVEQVDTTVLVRKYEINFMTLILVAVIILNIDPISISRPKNSVDELAEFVEEDSELHNGLGSFWKAGVVSCLNNYNNLIQAVCVSDEKLVPYLSAWYQYYDGGEYFNFIIEDKDDSSSGITEDVISQLYGECEEKYEEDTSNIYVYDYDIRTRPLYINANNNFYVSEINNVEDKIAIDKDNSIEISRFALTVGEVQIDISGDFEKNQLVVNSELPYEIKLLQSESNHITYVVEMTDLCDNFKFNISNLGNKECQIDSIRIAKNTNCNKLLLTDEDEIKLTPGQYIVGIRGEKVKNSSLKFEVNGKEIVATRINNGKSKVAYKFEIEETCNVHIDKKLKGNVHEIYYQNEIETMIEPTKGKIYILGDGIEYNENSKVYYGPYIELESGKYTVEISGEDINSENVCFTKECGTALKGYRLVEKKDDKLKYEIEIDDTVKDFEIVVNDCKQINYYFIVRSSK